MTLQKDLDPNTAVRYRRAHHQVDQFIGCDPKIFHLVEIKAEIRSYRCHDEPHDSKKRRIVRDAKDDGCFIDVVQRRILRSKGGGEIRWVVKVGAVVRWFGGIE